MKVTSARVAVSLDCHDGRGVRVTADKHDGGEFVEIETSEPDNRSVKIPLSVVDEVAMTMMHAKAIALEANAGEEASS